ncbi:MAG: SGNH/GDSL hydrolase family protein, partial [Chitinophagaceae bacterium]
MAATSFRYLALGDSYTVGEGVETKDSFPFQLIQTLNEKLRGLEILFDDPVVIAKTGWTTSELTNAISVSELKGDFDVVTMLIGVNNQYRGLSLEDYKIEFERLSATALNFTGNDALKVYVLSIPDWSATPFAASHNRSIVSFAIQRFNHVNRDISLKMGFHYLDITTGSRDALNDPSLVTLDQLHPSAAEYRKWSDQLADVISKRFMH